MLKFFKTWYGATILALLSLWLADVSNYNFLAVVFSIFAYVNMFIAFIKYRKIQSLNKLSKPEKSEAGSWGEIIGERLDAAYEKTQKDAELNKLSYRCNNCGESLKRINSHIYTGSGFSDRCKATGGQHVPVQIN